MTEPVLRILIAEDHTIVRKGLISLVSTPRFHIEVVGEASDGSEAVALAQKLKPDVIVMDLSMPKMDGIEAIQKILADNEDMRILVLTSFSSTGRATEAIRAGARGFLPKDSSPDDLIHAIRSVARGQSVVPAEVTHSLFSRLNSPAASTAQKGIDQLTEREITVMSRLVKGMSNKEIAAELCISANTVRSHVRTIFEKFGVTNRTQAALYAVENELLIV